MSNTADDFDAKIIKVDTEILALKAEVFELTFKYISEDVHAWISAGGCLDCNGTGVLKPWGEDTSPHDSIKCVHCDGRGPTYSLSFAYRAKPTSGGAYFPEPNYNAIDSARYAGIDVAYPPFWTDTRSAKKIEIENKIARLKASRNDLVRQKSAAAVAVVTAPALPVASKAVVIGADGLPDLTGVSLRQINYGVVCRRAALESGKVTQEEAASITSAVHWIENYKSLTRR
jgi:hypothetical protein